jgi:hypothetical protein
MSILLSALYVRYLSKFRHVPTQLSKHLSCSGSQILHMLFNLFHFIFYIGTQLVFTFSACMPVLRVAHNLSTIHHKLVKMIHTTIGH